MTTATLIQIGTKSREQYLNELQKVLPMLETERAKWSGVGKSVDELRFRYEMFMALEERVNIIKGRISLLSME